MLAHSTGKAMVTTGGDTWFFITADYAFGQALERDTTAVILANGGKVLGSVRHPINVNDFSSFLLQAQASKAKVVGLANAGGDTVNAIKQSAEFGLSKGGQHFRRSSGVHQRHRGAMRAENCSRAWSSTETWGTGHDRRQPRLYQAMARWRLGEPANSPEHGAGGRVFLGDPLPGTRLRAPKKRRRRAKPLSLR